MTCRFASIVPARLFPPGTEEANNRRIVIHLVGEASRLRELGREAPFALTENSERNGDEQTEQDRGFLELLEKDLGKLLSRLREALIFELLVEPRAQLHYILEGVSAHSAHI